jgi:hypothetical protein
MSRRLGQGFRRRFESIKLYVHLTDGFTKCRKISVRVHQLRITRLTGLLLPAGQLDETVDFIENMTFEAVALSCTEIV